MDGSMTPRERVMAVLRGEMPDQVPFTIKRPQPPQGEIERSLRNQGLTICTDALPFTIARPNVEVFRRERLENGRPCIRETLRTPVGEVWQEWSVEPAYDSRHISKHLVERLEDFEVVDFLFRDEAYTPAFEKFRRTKKILGQDGFLFAGWLPPTPILQMIWELMGAEGFAFALVDYPKAVHGLYETLLEKQREQVQLVADSPALVAHLQENLTAEIIGPKRFREYVLPVYSEFAAILHEKGKLLAAHCDGGLKAVADELATCGLDIIEAFCPPPDGNLPLAEDRRLWPDKILWINFPSPLHLRSPEEIEAHVRSILQDVAPGDRFLFGITEDIPDGVWDVSLPAISSALQKYGALPLAGV